MFFSGSTDGTVKLQSGASSDLTGAMPVADMGGFVLPYNPDGWFETASGEKLNAVLTDMTAMAGGLKYVTV